jgi:hypothetical protein
MGSTFALSVNNSLFTINGATHIYNTLWEAGILLVMLYVAVQVLYMALKALYGAYRFCIAVFNRLYNTS